MQNKRLFMNQAAVVFDDEIDEANGWETIVCSPVSSNYIRINPAGYKILRAVEEEPGLSLFQVALKAKQDEELTRKFLEQMITENVVLTQ